MTRLLRFGAAALAVAAVLPAQTLERAETYRRARQFPQANDEFRALVAKSPANPEYKVRWGRMYLEHAQPNDVKNAADLFNEALAAKKDYPGALLGMAVIAAQNFQPSAGDLARRALAGDPKLLEAQELLARIALEDNNTERATDEAKKALAIDTASVEGRATLATIDWLADKKETAWDPKDARGYATAGRFFVLNRRYEEGIEYYRRAIAMDPELYPARSQLGINLMRLGQNEEAYKHLEACFKADFQDAATTNSLRLMDSFKNFVTFNTPRTSLKLHKKEAELLHPYFEAELLRAIATYEKKYRIKLEHPVQLEVYPDHEDFAVRALGLPGLGALGVTFGYAVAMDSPSGRPPGTFHWASTLWHELSHVFTLTLTNHRVPRWFTEGLAVYEETAASPEWGDRLGPEEIAAIKGKKLLPVAQLDRGFIHPTGPAQVGVSYFQAGRICDYIVGKWGWDAILAMLHDFGGNTETAAVIRQQLHIEPAAFDVEFLAWLEAGTRPTVEHYDEWKKAVKTVAGLYEKHDWEGVIRDGSGIRDFYPDYVERGSVYEMLATAHLERHETPAATQELDLYVKRGGRNPEALTRLAGLLDADGRKREAAVVLEGLNMIYPMDGETHRTLGGLLLDLKDAPGAAREFQAVLARDPIDPARAHYDLARAHRLAGHPDQAKEEVLAALEAAPGYRPAQKMLLELSGPPTP